MGGRGGREWGQGGTVGTVIINKWSMRKKHEKVVLKSEVFKTKTPEKAINTPSRSPISRSPYLSKREDDRVDANDLFQKVCCPNCRFIFKIIKNADTLVHSNSRKKERTVSEMTQTEELFVRETNQIKNLSSELGKRLAQRNQSLVSKSLLKGEMSQIAEQSEGDVKQESFKLLEVTPVPSRTSQPNGKQSMMSSLKLGEKHSSQSSFLEQDKTVRSQEELRDILGQLYVSSKTKDLLGEVFKELPTSIEYPAYHKMLLLEQGRQYRKL